MSQPEVNAISGRLSLRPPQQKFGSNTERHFNARNELGAADVKAKAEAGALWCKHASDHAQTTGAKPWKYLLIAHDVVTEDKRLADYLQFSVAPS